MATDPRITVDPYTSNSSEIMRARCEKVNDSIGHALAHKSRLKIMARHNLSYVEKQQCEHSGAILSANIVQTCHNHAALDNHDQQATIGSHNDSATHDNKTDDGAHKDSHVATGDNDKAQDVTRNIAHDFTHSSNLSNTITDQYQRPSDKTCNLSRHSTRREVFSKLSGLRSDTSAFPCSELHQPKKLEDQVLKELERRG